MPTLAITVTSEVIRNANDIIQKGRGVMVLAHRQGRWELIYNKETFKDLLTNAHGSDLQGGDGTSQARTAEVNTQGQQPVVRGDDLDGIK